MPPKFADFELNLAIATARARNHGELDEVNAVIAILADVARSKKAGQTEEVSLNLINELTKIGVGQLRELWFKHKDMISHQVPGVRYDEDTVGTKYARTVVRYFIVPGNASQEGTSAAARFGEQNYKEKTARQRDRLQEMKDFVEAHAEHFRRHPHPFDFRASRGDSLYDYAQYVLGYGGINQKKRDLMLMLGAKLSEAPPATFAKIADETALAKLLAAESPEVVVGKIYFRKGPCQISGYEKRSIALTAPYNQAAIDVARKLFGSWNGSAWIFPSYQLEAVKQLCDLYLPAPSSRSRS